MKPFLQTPDFSCASPAEVPRQEFQKIFLKFFKAPKIFLLKPQKDRKDHKKDKKDKKDKVSSLPLAEDP